MGSEVESSAPAWFERWPELLEWELARFDAVGLTAVLDEDARTEGRISVSTTVTFRGGPIDVEISYPSEYPELPPTIFGPVGLLDRHQHAFGGNFCLLPRPLDDWPAAQWGAADLVAERLSVLLRDSEAGPDQVRTSEAPMPEPFSAYFSYAADIAVQFPEDAMPDASSREGQLEMQAVGKHLLLVVGSGSNRIDQELLDRLPPAQQEFAAPFRRIDSPPAAGSEPSDMLAWIRTHHPDLLARRPPPPPPGKRRQRPALPLLELCALVFPEEGPGVGEYRDAWVFLIVDRREGGERAVLVHSETLSAPERGRRLAELTGLDAKRVLVVGLGTVGAPIALELARGGVGKLDLVDCERFEFGNTPRHPLGIESVGMAKTDALAEACRRANPFCQVEGDAMRFGDPVWRGPSPLARVTARLQEADLLIDATGSHQLAQFLTRIAAEAGVPTVAAWMTDGFWGGEVVRIQPGTMCWTCFATAHRAGELCRAEAGPPSDVVVQGCSHPTTIGAGFDAAEVAAVAARLAVQTLEPPGGYPSSLFDHAALSFRRMPDDPELPRFVAEPLSAREGCEQCATLAGVLAAR